MKRKVTISLTCVLISIFFLCGCSDKKYADVEKATNQSAELMEQYVASLEKAGSAKDVAKAMNSFAEGMKKLQPTMKRLMEKYPELKDSQNPPEELKGVQTRMEDVGKRMSGAMMKIAQYMGDPEVQKAQQEMSSVMMSMQ
jgi:hypothetical protein